MHTLASAFVLGYHGCDQSTTARLLDGESFRPSSNEYDWLGRGIYFWEANPKRALDYAIEVSNLPRGPKITRPFVVGAVIELGLCLDLTTTSGLEQIGIAYERLVEISEGAETPLPQNSRDLLRRNLDCAVVNLLHDMRDEADLVMIDTVRGVFVEGEPIYPDAGFHEKTHIQICVCIPDCIKGVFRVPDRFLE